MIKVTTTEMIMCGDEDDGGDEDANVMKMGAKKGEASRKGKDLTTGGAI